MSICERWGNLLFNTTDCTKACNVKVKGITEPAQQDVYIYSIKLTDIPFEKHLFKGTVTAIK